MTCCAHATEVKEDGSVVCRKCSCILISGSPPRDQGDKEGPNSDGSCTGCSDGQCKQIDCEDCSGCF